MLTSVICALLFRGVAAANVSKCREQLATEAYG